MREFKVEPRLFRALVLERFRFMLDATEANVPDRDDSEHEQSDLNGASQDCVGRQVRM